MRCRHIPSSLLRFSQEIKAGGNHLCTLPLPHFSLPVSPERSLYIPLAPWFLWLPPGDTSGHLALVASRTYTCDPRELYRFPYFKSCC